MSPLEDDVAGGRFRAPATVLANLRRGVEEAPPGFVTVPLARAAGVLAKGSASAETVEAWVGYHSVARSGPEGLLYGGPAGARWVASLSESGALEEAFGGALTARAREKLGDRADRRRRDVNGRFAREISKLAKGGSVQIGNVRVSRDNRSGPVAKFAVQNVSRDKNSFEYAIGSGQALRLAKDASARDNHPASAGGRTRYKDRHDASLNSGREKKEPARAIVMSGRIIPHRELEDRGLEFMGPLADTFRGRAVRRLRNGGERPEGERFALDSQRIFKPGGAMVETKPGEYEYVGGKWQFDRMVYHRTMMARLFQGVPRGRGKPELLVMAGGGASGKTTALNSGAAEQPRESVLINPDVGKGMLTEFHELIAEGDKQAAAAVHEESSELMKTILAEAIYRRMNVTIDKTQIKPKEVAAALAAGYSVKGMVATVPIPVAQDRADKRGRKPISEGGGRFVDPQVLDSAHKDVAANFESWAKLGIPIVLQDTHANSRLAEVTGDGELRILDPEGYALFLSRAYQSER